MARKKIRVVDGPAVPMAPLPDTVVKSAGRALQILEIFENLKRPLMGVEIMEILSLPQSSTSALLHSLVAMGYLRFDHASHRYFPTTRVHFVGRWIGSRIFDDGRLVSMMQGIAAETGDSVALATAQDTSVRYLHAIQASGADRMRLTVGALLPLAETGSGLTLLSTYQDDYVKRLLHRINAYERPDAPPLPVREMVEQVREIRRHGYFYSEGLYNPDGAVFAHVLPLRDGNLPLVMLVGSTKARMHGRVDQVHAVVRKRLIEFMKVRHLDTEAARRAVRSG